MQCKIFLIKLLLSFSLLSNAQIQLDSILLPQKINETSGLEYYNDYLITHNDSGNAPRLYAINSEGELVLESTIHGTVNRDWEDLASDGSATVGIGLQGDYDAFRDAAAFTGFTANASGLLLTNIAAPNGGVKLQGSLPVGIVIGTAALTGGKFHVYVYYLPGV